MCRNEGSAVGGSLMGSNVCLLLLCCEPIVEEKLSVTSLCF